MLSSAEAFLKNPVGAFEYGSGHSPMILSGEASTHLTYLLGKRLRIPAGGEGWDVDIAQRKEPLTLSWSCPCTGSGWTGCWPGLSCMVVGGGSSEPAMSLLSSRVSSGSWGPISAQGEAWHWASPSVPDSLEENTPFCPWATHCEPPEAGSQPCGRDIRHSGDTLFHCPALLSLPHRGDVAVDR